MQRDAEEAFRRYLAMIPDRLLADVTSDFMWLAEEFADEAVGEDYRIRFDLCCAESARRSVRAA